MRRNHIFYIVAAACFLVALILLFVCLSYQSKRVTKTYALTYAEGKEFEEVK